MSPTNYHLLDSAKSFFFEKIKLDYTLKIRYLLFTIEFKTTQLSQTFWIYQKIKTPKKIEKTLLQIIIKSNTPKSEYLFYLFEQPMYAAPQTYSLLQHSTTRQTP